MLGTYYKTHKPAAAPVTEAPKAQEHKEETAEAPKKKAPAKKSNKK